MIQQSRTRHNPSRDDTLTCALTHLCTGTDIPIARFGCACTAESSQRDSRAVFFLNTDKTPSASKYCEHLRII